MTPGSLSKLEKKHHPQPLNPHAYILMEYGEENAASWRNKMSITKDDGRELLRSCFHLFLALRALHTQKLMHNDVKPENLIRISTHYGNVFKLSDFGMALSPDSYKWKNARMF